MLFGNSKLKCYVHNVEHCRLIVTPNVSQNKNKNKKKQYLKGLKKVSFLMEVRWMRRWTMDNGDDFSAAAFCSVGTNTGVRGVLRFFLCCAMIFSNYNSFCTVKSWSLYHSLKVSCASYSCIKISPNITGSLILHFICRVPLWWTDSPICRKLWWFIQKASRSKVLRHNLAAPLSGVSRPLRCCKEARWHCEVTISFFFCFMFFCCAGSTLTVQDEAMNWKKLDLLNNTVV